MPQGLHAAICAHRRFVASRIAQGQITPLDALLLRPLLKAFHRARRLASVPTRIGCCEERQDPSVKGVSSACTPEDPKTSEMLVGIQVQAHSLASDASDCEASQPEARSPFRRPAWICAKKEQLLDLGHGIEQEINSVAVYAPLAHPEIGSFKILRPEMLRGRPGDIACFLSRRSMESDTDLDEAAAPDDREVSFSPSTVPVYLMSSIHSAGYFDRRAFRVKAAHHRSHSASVLFTRSKRNCMCYRAMMMLVIAVCMCACNPARPIVFLCVCIRMYAPVHQYQCAF